MSAIPKTEKVVVVDGPNGHRRLVAGLPIAAGEVLFEARGSVHEIPTRYTLQVGENAHLGAADEEELHRAPERYIWCFLNHDCDPNAYFRGHTLLALRSVSVGEELSFDYNTTEWDMAEPFQCWCDAVPGAHHIRGFKYLSQERRTALTPFLGSWLKP